MGVQNMLLEVSSWAIDKTVSLSKIDKTYTLIYISYILYAGHKQFMPVLIL